MFQLVKGWLRSGWNAVQLGGGAGSLGQPRGGLNLARQSRARWANASKAAA
jgi:hypothetical protein